MRNSEVLGIVAEYNPFHTGHAHQLAEARAVSGARLVMVAMSGGVVQRGAFAIADKYTRARQALLAGADIVLETPARGVLQSAQGFAEASAGLLCALGAGGLSFGSEGTPPALLRALAALMQNPDETWKNAFEQAIKQGQGYAHALTHATAAAIAHRPPEEQTHMLRAMRNPNDTLALAYLQAVSGDVAVYPILRTTPHGVEETLGVVPHGAYPTPACGSANDGYAMAQGAGRCDGCAVARDVPRCAGHDASDDAFSEASDPTGHEVAEHRSASRLRAMLAAGEPIDAYVPPEVLTLWRQDIAGGTAPIDAARLDALLLHQLRSLPLEALQSAPGLGEGLAERCAKLASACGSLPELLAAMQTKRYPNARIRRGLLCAVLGISNAAVCDGISGGDSGAVAVVKRRQVNAAGECLSTQKNEEVRSLPAVQDAKRREAHILTAPRFARVLAAKKSALPRLAELCRKNRIPLVMQPARQWETLSPEIQAVLRENALAHDLHVLARANPGRRAAGEDARRCAVLDAPQDNG